MEFVKTFATGIDARVNIKYYFKWLQAIARLLVVSTFINDALHVGGDYAGQVGTMEMLWDKSPISSVISVQRLAGVLPLVFVAVQAVGVMLILSETRPQLGCVVLISWTAVHPLLYKQQTNAEFMLESVTIMGGLLILLSSERAKERARSSYALPTREREALLQTAGGREGQFFEIFVEERALLAGRVCVSAVFVYYIAKMMYERVASLEAPTN